MRQSIPLRSILMKSGELILEENEYLLQMQDICKAFPGVKALDNARLYVRHGSVHALVGENGAGKSTLMKCLFGIYSLDSGAITLEGENVRFNNPRQALAKGVSMVHQELDQVLGTNVMENIWLGRFPRKHIMVDEEKMYEDTKKIFSDLDIKVDPRQKIKKLSISERQMVEISKAVSYNSKIIVMDEPTSSLTEKEVEHLFNIINKLKKSGCSIIYISHKMDEILKISDNITIMRDGKWIASEKASNITIDRIINLMVGREMNQLFPPKDNVPDKVILSVKDYSDMKQPSIKDVSFELHEGEILGIGGLMGSKRTELVENLFGIRRKGKGEIFYKGQALINSNPRMAIKNGFALLTEERRQNGIFQSMSVKFNTVIANIKGYSNKLGILNNKKTVKETKWVIDTLKVKTPSQSTLIKSLSGGNQQKVILGRWLLTDPKILMLDEPTRGIDVGAKYEIYNQIISLAKQGKGVIFISSEMPELLGISDRILVMSNGRVAGIVEAKDTNQEEIFRLASKYL